METLESHCRAQGRRGHGHDEPSRAQERSQRRHAQGAARRPSTKSRTTPTTGAWCSRALVARSALAPTCPIRAARRLTPRVRVCRGCAGWATWRWRFTTSQSPRLRKWTGSPSAPACRSRSAVIWCVCSDRAKLSMIFSKRGLALDNGASWLLPRLVGMAKAKEIALFGGMWSGEEAAAMGLVNRVLPLDELDAFVDDWARTLAAGPPLALSMTKTLLHASSMASMEQAVEDEARPARP